MRRLVIDIGTNSVLALLARVSNDKIDIIFDSQRTLRLGEGLTETGRLSTEAMKRTLKAIAGFLDQEWYDDVMLLGTEALRAGSNADEFLWMIRELTGIDVIVLSGEKEAFLTFKGALFGLADSGKKIMVIDVGGGSSDISIGNDGEFSHAVSIPIGAARLYEMKIEDTLDSYIAKATEIIMDKIGGFNPGETEQVIVTGGTITSVAAIYTGMKKYAPALIHGIPLSVEEVKGVASRFEGIERTRREQLIPLDLLRADLILPGTGIILAMLGISDKDRLRVSTGGLRFGAVLNPELARKT